MTVEHYIIAGLMGYLILRELFFLYSMQKLVNKLMSRDYYSYKMSENMKPAVEAKPKAVDEDAGMAEDLNHIFN